MSAINGSRCKVYRISQRQVSRNIVFKSTHVWGICFRVQRNEISNILAIATQLTGKQVSSMHRLVCHISVRNLPRVHARILRRSTKNLAVIAILSISLLVCIVHVLLIQACLNPSGPTGRVQLESCLYTVTQVSIPEFRTRFEWLLKEAVDMP